MNKNLKNKNKKVRNGFTLVEILTASFVFILIIMIATGLFAYTSRIQGQILVHQKLLNETSYVIEYMSRALRMAAKSDGICIPTGSNYEISTSTSIKFINSLEKDADYQCQEFYLYSTSSIKLKYVKKSEELPLTSENINIKYLKFNLSEQDAGGNNLQPFVTMLVEAEAKNAPDPNNPPRIKIQTSISQRNLDE